MNIRPQPEFLIELKDVRHSYWEGITARPVLQGISERIRTGEFVALLGQSGSGKSTLLNLIGGLELPSAGAIGVNGVVLSDLGEPERTLFRRRHIGFVYQFFNLLPTLTALENVALPAELNGLPGKQARERARALLGQVGLGDRCDTYPDHLSGGEQQRIALARALVHSPCLLLADEPTGNLDSRTGRQVLNLLAESIKHRGMTLLVATHSPDVAERADRVWHLRDGRLGSEAA